MRGRLSRTKSSSSNKDSEYDESDDGNRDEEKPFDEYLESTDLLMTMEPQHYYPSVYCLTHAPKKIAHSRH